MAVNRSRVVGPSSASERRQEVRQALLHTLPGRVVVIALAIKLIDAAARAASGELPAFLRVVDTVAGLAIAAVAAYLLFRLSVIVKRRLLWRVRRKLILSYIFVGFVPALLIVAFFLLSGLLLFYNFSSYLVQSRFRAMGEQARFLAENAALDVQRGGGRDVAAVLARRQTSAAGEYPGVSMAIVPVERACADTTAQAARTVSKAPAASAVVGPWAHVSPPNSVPTWIDCSGFAGLLAYSHGSAQATSAPPPAPAFVSVGSQNSNEHVHLLVRAAVFPDTPRPSFAVIVDMPVTDQIRQRLRSETGVEVKTVTAVRDNRDSDVAPLVGREGAEDSDHSQGDASNGLLSLGNLLEYRDWATGKPGALVVSTQLSVAELYDRISAAQGLFGRRFGQGLLLLLLVIGGLFLIIECVALITGLALAKSITGSVHELFTGTERVRQGDFTHKIAVKSEDQLGELAGSFNSMTASIEDLLRQAAEKKRLEEELRIAHEIQMSLLPHGPTLMPGLSVTSLCVPAREVGGDYYDFLPLDDHRVGILIADVSGKGTSAALYMAELKGLVLSLSKIHTSPRDLLVSANRIIAEHLDARSFITMTYALVDLQARTMTYARAGHTPLMYLPGPGVDSRRVRVLAPDGLVLGLKIDNGEMFERLLEEETIPLHAGDLYLFFTDGITEAMNAGDDCFGEGRLGELVERHGHLASDELRERVLREIQAFVGDAPQHDDMTMILLRIEDFALPAHPPVAAEPAEIAK